MRLEAAQSQERNGRQSCDHPDLHRALRARRRRVAPRASRMIASDARAAGESGTGAAAGGTVWRGSWQSRWTLAAVVWPARTSNVVAPWQVVPVWAAST